MYLLLLVGYRCVDKAYFISTYRKIVWVCVAFFYIQFLLYYVTGAKIVGVAQFLPLTSEFGESGEFLDRVAARDRFSSFFSEPAHYVQYVLPFLCIAVFDDKLKKDYLLVTLSILSLLLIQSGTALVGLAGLGLAFMIKILKNKRKSLGIILLLLFLAVLSVVAYYYVSSEIGQSMISRQDEITNVGEKSSGFIRIFRGYFVIAKYSLVQLLLGVNDPKILESIVQSSSVAWAFADEDLYFNGVQSLIVKTGVIGMIIFYLYLIKTSKRSQSPSKVAMLVYFLLSFQASVFWGHTMMLYLMVIYIYSYKYKRRVRINEKKKVYPQKYENGISLL